MKQQEKARKAQEGRREGGGRGPCPRSWRGLTVKVAAKAGEGGRLFRRRHRQGDLRVPLPAARRQHRQGQAGCWDEPIKSCGGYQVKAKLGYEVTGMVNVVVVEA